MTKPGHDWNEWLGCWVPGDVWGVDGERAFGLDLVGDVSAKYVRYSKADNMTAVSTWVIRGTKRVTIFYFIQ